MSPHVAAQAPTDALHRLLGGEALADINEVPQEHLEAVYDDACDHVEREDFDNALDLMLFLVVNDPYDVRFQFGFGLCLHQLGRVEDAARHYGLAWMLDPSDAGCAFRLGECHEAFGDRDAAIEAFQTAIALCNLPDAPPDVRQLSEAALDRLNS